MRKLFILLLLLSCGLCRAAAGTPSAPPPKPGPPPVSPKPEGPWKMTVELRGARQVFRLGETARFLFTLTGADGKPGAFKEMKIELWLDGDHHVRRFIADNSGRILVEIRPEKQCLVRCRAEYGNAFAVGSATFSLLPKVDTGRKLYQKRHPPVDSYR